MSLLKPLWKNLPLLSSVGLCVYVTARSVPETIGIYYLKKTFQLTENGLPVSLPPETVGLYQEVLDDICLSAGHEANIDFFQTKHPWIVSRGSVHNGTGVIIGLPCSYNRPIYQHNSVSNLCDTNSNNTSLMQAEKNSVTLSENAKLFSIARDIYASTTYYLWVENFMAVGLCISGYWMGSFTRLYGGLKKWARVSTYTTLGVSSCFALYFLTAYYSKHRQAWMDQQAVKLGEKYASGAEEFYTALSEYETFENKTQKTKSMYERFLLTSDFLFPTSAEVRKKTLVKLIDKNEIQS